LLRFADAADVKMSLLERSITRAKEGAIREMDFPRKNPTIKRGIQDVGIFWPLSLIAQRKRQKETHAKSKCVV
jgi:hypothetical protein